MVDSYLNSCDSCCFCCSIIRILFVLGCCLTIYIDAMATMNIFAVCHSCDVLRFYLCQYIYCYNRGEYITIHYNFSGLPKYCSMSLICCNTWLHCTSSCNNWRNTLDMEIIEQSISIIVFCKEIDVSWKKASKRTKSVYFDVFPSTVSSYNCPCMKQLN